MICVSVAAQTEVKVALAVVISDEILWHIVLTMTIRFVISCIPPVPYATARCTQQPPQVHAVRESLPVLEDPLSKQLHCLAFPLQQYMNAFLLDFACQRYFSCSNLL